MMQLTGLRSVWILDNGYAASPTPPIAREYVEALHPSAVFADYGGWIVPNPPAVIFIDGVPVVHALWGPDVGSTVGRIRLAAVGAGSRPAFVLVALSAWTMGFSEAQAVMQRLGPGYRVVRPDRFVGLLKQTRPAV